MRAGLGFASGGSGDFKFHLTLCLRHRFFCDYASGDNLRTLT